MTKQAAPRRRFWERAVSGYSGGIGSYAGTLRYVDAYGTDGLTLLFTDVKGSDCNPFVGEDIDTYRFLIESAADIFGVDLPNTCPSPAQTKRAHEMCDQHGWDTKYANEIALYLHYRQVAADHLDGKLVWLQDGRDIYDVFFEKGWLGNSQLSHCSWELKTIPSRKYLDENHHPNDTVVLVGMDWTETNRHGGVHRNYAHNLKGCADPKHCRSLWGPEGRLQGPGWCKNVLDTPWTVLMPLNEGVKYAKPQMLSLARERGVEPGRLYAMGFPHSNCIGCVKAGQAQWARDLEIFPDHFAYAERREQEFRASRGSRAEASHLKESVAGESRPLSLTEFRRRYEEKALDQFELDFSWGGCGCANEENPDKEGGAA